MVDFDRNRPVKTSCLDFFLTFFDQKWHMLSLSVIFTILISFLARHSFHFFPQNNKDAEAYWIQAANEGDGSVTAMVDLGKYYFANEHYKDAFYWYQCATGRGDAHSQACIGKIFGLNRCW